MNTILITGCNRGIGLGLVKNILVSKNPPRQLIATCRSLQKAKELLELKSKHNNLTVLEIDVCDFEKHEQFASDVGKIVEDNGLNVLFNNAGVSTKFSRIGLCKANVLISTITTNTVAPIMLSKAFLPLLKKAAKNSPNEIPINKACIINMSSILGSIAENDSGGSYPYRCSKAALNMATKCLSIDLKNDGIVAVSFHPGWVRTDMGGKNAPLDVDTSTKRIWDTLQNLKQSDSGAFLQFDGKPIAF